MIVLSLLLLASAPQSMPKADFVSEGEAVGRLGESLQICKRQGYPVDELVAEDAANRFAARAMASGWSHALVADVIDAGIEAERASMPFSEPLYDLPADELVDQAAGLAGQVRSYCHALSSHRPGAITDLDGGDREVNARLAHARRAAADILARQQEVSR